MDTVVSACQIEAGEQGVRGQNRALAAGNPEMLLDVLERTLHSSRSEWIFFRELRAGTGVRNSSAQRMDAFALNCFPHLGMKRVCYEVKVSRADFCAELKRPLKRRVGMRYSNEFYFITPKGLIDPGEIPAECGLVEIGSYSAEERLQLTTERSAVFLFDERCGLYCVTVVPACWRDTPGPTWQFTAAMLRNQRRELEDKGGGTEKQQKLDLFSGDSSDLFIT